MGKGDVVDLLPQTGILDPLTDLLRTGPVSYSVSRSIRIIASL